jgi:PKD repeat protein
VVAFSAGTSPTIDVNWDWGDDSSDTVNGATSPASAGHSYADPGVYQVTVTVSGADGSASATLAEYVVIYDPDGGFVTGGGWIDSPAGAYAADPDLTGKANFGFNSKYKKGASVPDGNTNFQFQAGDLHFQSTSYDWLVVAGQDRAKFKGEGTINGEGEYGFMLTATDGSPDTFRIKTWVKETEVVVYDNQMGVPDDDYAGTELGGGNIKVHKAN